MNRRNRTLIVVGLAVVLAGLASYLVYRAVQRIPVLEVTIVERQQVVATGRIEAGSIVSANSVRLTPWPADAPVPGGFERVEDVIGRGVTMPILPNEPVTESKLAIPGAGLGLATMIPEGMLAMAVRVNDVTGVSGFVLPGSRVDVIATGSPDNAGPMSRIVLSNVQVIAIGPATAPPDEQNTMPPTVATLLVTPEDSERLTLAQNQGNIMLALRNGLDVVQAETEGVRLSALFSGTNPQPVRTTAPSGRTRVVTPPPPPPAPTPTIDIIRGAQRSTQEVKGGGGSQGSGSEDDGNDGARGSR